MSEEALTQDAPVAFSLDGLAEWVADAAVDHAARSRSRTQSLICQQSQEATMVDLLAELADRGRSVCVTLTAGRKLVGIVRAVGDDFMILHDAGMGDVIVPFKSLAAVLPGAAGARTAQRACEPVHEERACEPVHEEMPPGTRRERPASLLVCLGDALVDLAAERALILAEVAGESLRGELRAAGQDVVTLRLDPPERRHLHVRTNAIDYAVLIGH